jgi:hypothetical protein
MSTKKKTTSTQTNTAATWAQPSITSSLSGLDAASKVSSGNAAAVQPALMQAVNSVANGISTPPAYLQAAGNQLTNTINGGSQNPYTAQMAGYNTTNPYTASVGGYDTSNPYASQIGNYDTSNPYAAQIAGQTFDGGSNQYIGQLASGQNDYIDKLMTVNEGTNPYASAMADQLGQKTGANYAASFGTAGRSGSGLAALLGTQGIGDTLNSFYSNQYNTDQGYRNSALTNAANLKQQSLISAAGFQDSDLARALQAQQMQSQALQSAGGLYDSSNARGLQAQTAAGGLYDSSNARGLQAQTAAGSMADASNARGLSALSGAANISSDDLNRQLSAVGQASNLYGGSLQGISPLLNLAQTSTLLPLQGASAYSGAVGQLTQPYGTQQTKSTETTGGLGTLVGPALQLGGMLASGGMSGGLSGLLGGGASALAGAGIAPMGSLMNVNHNITGLG